MNGWLALLAAGLLEVGWALGLKYSDGLTRFWPTVATLVAIALSFGLMAIALRSLPFGTAYAVWTGIGAVGSILPRTGELVDQLRKRFRRVRGDKVNRLANGATFFQTLLDAVKAADGVGFSWCNETSYAVMAALGVDENGAVTTRGWYRVDAGKCVKPDLPAKPARLYSFAEAVDKEGQSLRRGDRLLTWGGPTQLCTRDVRFEISEQVNCSAQGLTATGFAVIDLAGKPGATVRFRE